MRRVAALALMTMVGCFQELPAPPGESADATAGESTGGTAGESTGGAPTTTTASSGGAEPDVDESTTASSGGAEPSEGLFACKFAAACEAWDCQGGCDAAGPVGACVLAALRDRTTGLIEVERCDGECVAHRLIVRGGGDDRVRWQWRSLAAPGSYSEPRTCTLAPAEFFAACLTSFGPDCADPMTWVAACQTGAAMCL